MTHKRQDTIDVLRANGSRIGKALQPFIDL